MKSTVKSKVEIGHLSDFPKQLGKTVIVGEEELAVFRLSDQKVRAVTNRCPHKNGVLAEGIVSGEFVFCPMHDWKISLQDGKVQAPDVGCVHTYEAVVENGRVYVMV
ncbi:nitrite reductase small subunit NirD [Priestia endophytica]|jgi:nitrite reductase (NADH) small subunit|uniref:Nitrite reductase (NADH) small subunit n=1 Tax=Priestia endophytica DSM 13796 TaxID=1121089 RepID=A0A1I6AIJ0_9BACI|nr:nitrite reductase small subunit NirD [Priestia endophytica]KAB2493292.1 nitrite reductase small subunit NirD [Priestia endophytica]KYG27516.1 nitrite reductase [Priestia endophytica]MBG9814341.1 nitrite reductase [Priestia endophytica]RAS86961.1 nitrite reductase (NAD(P)H) small subunit [Priestia endophytica]SFQ68473.1 nitrite reductase (NADH) small subunit [Priestia endophytica DSM 13796]